MQQMGTAANKLQDLPQANPTSARNVSNSQSATREQQFAATNKRGAAKYG
jgi:hypothetical protein